jgi:hypothetical protein
MTALLPPSLERADDEVWCYRTTGTPQKTFASWRGLPEKSSMDNFKKYKFYKIALGSTV